MNSFIKWFSEEHKVFGRTSSIRILQRKAYIAGLRRAEEICRLPDISNEFEAIKAIEDEISLIGPT